MKLRLETAAMDALTVRLFDAIDESNMAWIMAADEALRRAFDHALIDLIPSYTTLLVHYDCQKLTFAQATTLVRSALRNLTPADAQKGQGDEGPATIKSNTIDARREQLEFCVVERIAPRHP